MKTKLDQEIAQLTEVKAELQKEKDQTNEAKRKLAEAEKRLAVIFFFDNFGYIYI
jgi:hypothetical protein